MEFEFVFFRSEYYDKLLNYSETVVSEIRGFEKSYKYEVAWRTVGEKVVFFESVLFSSSNSNVSWAWKWFEMIIIRFECVYVAAHRRSLKNHNQEASKVYCLKNGLKTFLRKPQSAFDNPKTCEPKKYTNFHERWEMIRFHGQCRASSPVRWGREGFWQECRFEYLWPSTEWRYGLNRRGPWAPGCTILSPP